MPILGWILTAVAASIVTGLSLLFRGQNNMRREMRKSDNKSVVYFVVALIVSIVGILIGIFK